MGWFSKDSDEVTRLKAEWNDLNDACTRTSEADPRRPQLVWERRQAQLAIEAQRRREKNS